MDNQAMIRTVPQEIVDLIVDDIDILSGASMATVYLISK